MSNPYLRKMNPPPIARHGAAWHWEIQWLDGTSGDPFDFTAHPELTFTTKLMNPSGATLATFSSNPATSPDGTIGGDAYGVLAWDLPLAKVNGLPITRTYRGGADPRTATWRNRGLIVFDLTCSDGTTTWTFFDEQLVVCAATH